MTEFQFFLATMILTGDCVATNRLSDKRNRVVATSFLGDTVVLAVVYPAGFHGIMYFKQDEVVKVWPQGRGD